MKVLEQVFDPQPLEEALAQKPADRENDLADVHLGRFANVVDRLYLHFPQGTIGNVELDQHVVGHAVAGIDLVEPQRLERGQRNGRVAGLRVRDAPVARGDFGQHGQDGVAEIAYLGDDQPGRAVDEPIALDVVDALGHHRPADAFQLRRVHLAVSGHDRRAVDAVVLAPLVAARDGRAHAAVLQVVDEDDAVDFRPGVDHRRGGEIAQLLLVDLAHHGLGLVVAGGVEGRVLAGGRGRGYGFVALVHVGPHHGLGAVPGTVVNHHDAVHEVRYGFEDLQDLPFLVVGGNDHSHGFAKKHIRSLR